jgi:hypothetical protein
MEDHPVAQHATALAASGAVARSTLAVDQQLTVAAARARADLARPATAAAARLAGRGRPGPLVAARDTAAGRAAPAQPAADRSTAVRQQPGQTAAAMAGRKPAGRELARRELAGGELAQRSTAVLGLAGEPRVAASAYRLLVLPASPAEHPAGATGEEEAAAQAHVTARTTDPPLTHPTAHPKTLAPRTPAERAPGPRTPAQRTAAERRAAPRRRGRRWAPGGWVGRGAWRGAGVGRCAWPEAAWAVAGSGPRSQPTLIPL